MVLVSGETLITLAYPNTGRDASPGRRHVDEKPRRMRSRAAILYEYGRPWSVEEFELDPPRAGEVLLRLAATGLCHSDEHIRQGKLAPPPDILRSLGLPAMSPTIGGHEGSGVVVEVGEGVTRFAPGDHVVTSFVAVCGQCRWCASGMEYLCDTGSGTLAPGMPTDGTFRHHTVDGRNLGHVSKIGAFAEHTVVSANSLVKIDPGLPLVPAALLACAVPTGYGSAARRAKVRGGDTAVVIGAGGIGTAAIELVRELTRGVMADAVVVSPAMIGEADVGTALALTRKGGTCVLTGLPSPTTDSIALTLQDFILMNKTLCGTVFGSCNPKSDIPLLAELYLSGQLLLDEMITKRYGLDEINDAYADLTAGRLIRGVIDFGVG
jgi:Zn-dependent alcohol dehydrogenase